MRLSRQLSTVLGIIILISTIVLAGCVQQTTPAQSPAVKSAGPQYGGTLRVGSYGENSAIGYPPKMTTMLDRMAGVPSIQSLFRLNTKGEVIPWLATGYKENIADNSITISLRKGVKFQDGTDFTAEAAKWCLDTWTSAKMAGTELFKSVDIVDDYTIRINLKQWDNTVITNLYVIGMMISPTAYKKNGADWCLTNPVGTGPFQLVNFNRSGTTKWTKFDGYWEKGKPYVDAIEYTPIINLVTRTLALKAGEIDIAVWLDIKDLDDLQKAGFLSEQQLQGAYGLIGDSINTASPWSNLKVRQAAQYALDGKAISNLMSKGLAGVPNQLIYPGHWAYNQNVVGYPYDPAKAKQLLAEAGYKDGFKTKISYTLDPFYALAYGAVQGYWRAVGIDTELEPVQVARYLELYHGGTWNGLLHASSTSIDVAANYSTRVVNKTYFTNMLKPDDLVQAVSNAISAPDFATKQKYTQEASKLMVDKYCLWEFVYFPVNLFITGKNVHNPSMGSQNSWWTPEDVWKEK